MKKLSIIAALAFSSLLFASCEANDIAPATSAPKPFSNDYEEPEFGKVSRNINAEQTLPAEQIAKTTDAERPETLSFK
jgi:PBP1b-binding outer membrane lipoprotein LpoB